MSHRALSERQFFHGTSVTGAESIINEGARAGINVTHDRQTAEQYVKLWEPGGGYGGEKQEHQIGGVLLEGKVVGDDHYKQPWGVVTKTPGAFVPQRKHYPDGRVEDV